MPILLTPQIQPAFDGVVHPGAWLPRLVGQCHARILQTLAALSMVTRFAAGYHVSPFVPTTAATGNYVIHGKIFLHHTAVLTRKPIADKNLPAAELNSWPRSTHKCPQSNDRGHLIAVICCVKVMGALL